MAKCRDCKYHYIELEERTKRDGSKEIIKLVKCEDNEPRAHGGEPKDSKCFVPIKYF